MVTTESVTESERICLANFVMDARVSQECLNRYLAHLSHMHQLIQGDTVNETTGAIVRAAQAPDAVK